MTSSVRSFASSEEEESSGEEATKPFLKGVLSKWTNYYHGWQDRYLCCENGTICYYRSHNEIDYGCRGSISLAKATLTLHEFDPCRFDLSINDSFWYLRAETESVRQQWIDVIEANKVEADCLSLRSETSIGSLLSPEESGIDEKILELKTFKNILNTEINCLLSFFEAKVGQYKNAKLEQWMKNGDVGSSVDATIEDELTGNLNEMTQVDFKGQVMTMRATASGIQSTLSQCIDVLKMREEMWTQKCQDLERRLKNEEKKAQSLKQEKNNILYANLDNASLPSSEVTQQRDDYDDTSDDEFYDPNNNFEQNNKPHHRYANQLDEKIREHLQDSLYCSNDEEWETLVDDRGLQLHRKELVKDGIVCDPIKGIYQCDGVTAKELCQYFWDAKYRRDWDTSIEDFNVLETIDDVTIVAHQVHVQMWPIAQRDCLYVSTILKVEDAPQREIPHRDTWMVCSTSIDHPDGKLVEGRIRAQIEVAMICQTHVTPPSGGGPVTRNCLKTDMIYIANVNPGGWAPASVLRAVGKREYPKFMRTFSAFVQEKTKNLEIVF